MLKISLFASNLVAIMYALLALDSPNPWDKQILKSIKKAKCNKHET